MPAPCSNDTALATGPSEMKTDLPDASRWVTTRRGATASRLALESGPGPSWLGSPSGADRSMTAEKVQGSSPSTFQRCQVPRCTTQSPAPSSTLSSSSSSSMRPSTICTRSMVSVRCMPGRLLSKRSSSSSSLEPSPAAAPVGGSRSTRQAKPPGGGSRSGCCESGSPPESGVKGPGSTCHSVDITISPIPVVAGGMPSFTKTDRPCSS
jgi:hypothetical protein